MEGFSHYGNQHVSEGIMMQTLQDPLETGIADNVSPEQIEGSRDKVEQRCGR